jgi:ferredoxin-NADP reductase
MALSRSLAAAFEQFRRDAATVTGRLSGKKRPIFTSRHAPATGRGNDAAARLSALLSPRTVRVAKVVRETPDAVSLVLEDPSGAPLTFAPGQFFTLLVRLGDAGEVFRRAYSASSSAHDADRVSVTVKRVARGLVSNHLNDAVRAGDLLQVLGPSGSFTPPTSGGAARHLVLLAGGSGITPMMAIARTLLAAEPATRVTLIYGNRGEGDIIFRSALAELEAVHGAARFRVRHVLSHPSESWTEGVGMLDEGVAHTELESLGPLDDDALYFVCGPEPMMRACRAALTTRGVAGDRIVEERFNTPHLRARPSAASEGPQVLTIRANGSGVREVYVAPSQTMLEAGLGSGVAMGYSCAVGGCAACKVRLCDGQVDMEEPNCLSAEERGQGYILACVSRLRTAATIALAGDPAFAPREQTE